MKRIGAIVSKGFGKAQPKHKTPDYAKALAQVGRWDEAEAVYQELLRQDPDHQPELYLELGMVQRQRGQLNSAMLALQQAVIRQPKAAPVYEQLGLVLVDQGDFGRAQAMFEKAISLQPEAPDPHCHLGLALQSQGQFEAALPHFERALGQQPDHLEARYRLGKTLWQLGRAQEAIPHLQRILALDPDHVYARYLLGLIGILPRPERAPVEWVAQLFDDYAATFEVHLCQHLRYRGPEILRQTLLRTCGSDPHWQRGIDLGCGTGLCGQMLRNWVDHLVGVDLSPQMIAQAQKRRVYDVLSVADLLSELAKTRDRYDLAVAADVLIYFGDLAELFRAVGTALAAGGLFAFTVEAGSEPYALGSGLDRFAHSPGYIRQLAERTGFQERSFEEQVIRQQGSEPVLGHIWLLQK